MSRYTLSEGHVSLVNFQVSRDVEVAEVRQAAAVAQQTYHHARNTPTTRIFVNWGKKCLLTLSWM